ncbi:hypothetical protein G5C01_06445 [Moraxella bovoculi]|uniref:hypothetical protein n=1 Tax=Moraxella bovoculi TaxID=386891 RepID=UPI00156D75B2|nr:hypothetical protein [Moraxella bovoculi]NSM10994.1 hypothetical protein [Moraxella bovoculi]
MTQYERDKLRYFIKRAYDKLDKHTAYADYFKAYAHAVLRADTLQEGLEQLQANKTPLMN